MDIGESLERMLAREEIVTDLFYDIFLDRHPEVQRYFVGVNLHHQAAVLQMALVLMEHHLRHGTPAIKAYLKVLGHRHEQRGVPTEHYPKFRDCLLETFARFHGPDWDDALSSQWGAAIDKAAAVMQGVYAKRVVY